MKRLLLGILCFSGAAFSQAVQQVLPNPDCQVFFAFTAAGQNSAVQNNLQQGCTSWQFSYTVTGFSAVSVVLQSAANSAGVPGSYATGFPVQQTIVSGSNPGTSTTAGFFWVQGTNAFTRMHLTSVTGTGMVQGALFGWRIPNAASQGGGGGGTIAITTNTLKGDGAGNAVAVSGTGTNCVLVNGSSAACSSTGSVLGTALFSSVGGTISGLTITGSVTGVTYVSTGRYTVALSGSPTNYKVTMSAQANAGTFIAAPFLFATPGTAGFDMGLLAVQNSALQDFPYISVVVIQ